MSRLSIVNESWLNKNDLRKYPLMDSSTVADNRGVVDLRLSYKTSDLSASLSSYVFYVQRLVVSSRLARIDIYLQRPNGASFTDEGVCTVEVDNPTPYRAYALNPIGSKFAQGFVIFGAAITDPMSRIDYVFTATTGRILPTLVDFYKVVSAGRDQITGQDLGSNLKFQSSDTVLCSIQQVSFQSGQSSSYTAPAVVIEMNPGNKAITEIIPPCKRPADSGISVPTVKSINGVPADKNGNITLDLISDFDYEYEADGSIKFDEAGQPVRQDGNDGKRVLSWEANGHWLTMQDNIDYTMVCAKKIKRRIKYSRPHCAYCFNEDRVELGGIDGKEMPKSYYTGVYIYGNRMFIAWIHHGENPLQGALLPVVEAMNSLTDAVTCEAFLRLHDESLKVYLPAPLPPICEEQSQSSLSSRSTGVNPTGDVGPQVGRIVWTEYKLSRQLKIGDKVNIVGPSGLLVDTAVTAPSQAFALCLEQTKELGFDNSSSTSSYSETSSRSDGISGGGYDVQSLISDPSDLSYASFQSLQSDTTELIDLSSASSISSFSEVSVQSLQTPSSASTNSVQTFSSASSLTSASQSSASSASSLSSASLSSPSSVSTLSTASSNSSSSPSTASSLSSASTESTSSSSTGSSVSTPSSESSVSSISSSTSTASSLTSNSGYSSSSSLSSRSSSTSTASSVSSDSSSVSSISSSTSSASSISSNSTPSSLSSLSSSTSTASSESSVSSASTPSSLSSISSSTSTASSASSVSESSGSSASSVSSISSSTSTASSGSSVSSVSSVSSISSSTSSVSSASSVSSLSSLSSISSSTSTASSESSVSSASTPSTDTSSSTASAVSSSSSSSSSGVIVGNYLRTRGGEYILTRAGDRILYR